MDFCKKIMNVLKKLSGRYTLYDVFSDWISMLALSLSNSVKFDKKIWECRENEYLRIAKKYTNEELPQFIILYGLLIDALEQEKEDILGRVYCTLSLESKALKQCFTPPHVSDLMAELTLCNSDEIIKRKKRIDILEPACGSGTMIVSAIKYLYSKGYHYQKILHVVAQDVDLKCVYMTFIQCSLLGIQAEVAFGNSITDPYPSADFPSCDVFKTPFYFLGPVLFAGSGIYLDKDD